MRRLETLRSGGRLRRSPDPARSNSARRSPSSHLLAIERGKAHGAGSAGLEPVDLGRGGELIDSSSRRICSRTPPCRVGCGTAASLISVLTRRLRPRLPEVTNVPYGTMAVSCAHGEACHARAYSPSSAGQHRRTHKRTRDEVHRAAHNRRVRKMSAATSAADVPVAPRRRLRDTVAGGSAAAAVPQIALARLHRVARAARRGH